MQVVLRIRQTITKLSLRFVQKIKIILKSYIDSNCIDLHMRVDYENEKRKEKKRKGKEIRYIDK